MGGDGGTTAGKRSFTKGCQQNKKENESDGKASQRKAAWTHCSLSHRNLKLPLVADVKGSIMRKDAVIEHLLKRKEYKEGENPAPHISKLKHVVDLLFESSEKAKAAATSDAEVVADTDLTGLVTCPLTGAVGGGSQAFCFFWECGHVSSVQASDEIANGLCPWPNCTAGIKRIDLGQSLKDCDSPVNPSQKRPRDGNGA
jgi:hypothetical protein